MRNTLLYSNSLDEKIEAVHTLAIHNPRGAMKGKLIVLRLTKQDAFLPQRKEAQQHNIFTSFYSCFKPPSFDNLTTYKKGVLV